MTNMKSVSYTHLGSNIGELIRLLEKRTEGDTKEAERAVAEILADVKENGDVALIK